MCADDIIVIIPAEQLQTKLLDATTEPLLFNAAA